MTHGANSDTRATDLGGRLGRRPGRRDASRPEPRPGRPGLARPPAGSACRRPADRRGRLPGPAQLLDRHAGRRAPRHDHRRAHRRRGGLPVPRRRASRSATSSSCADRSAAISSGQPDARQPLLLAGGGSGIVPLMAMLRARVAAGSDVPVRLLVSARSIDEIIYRAELESIAGAAWASRSTRR